MLGTESGLDKVSTEIQGLSSIDCNFQGLSRAWNFYFKISRTFLDFQDAYEPCNTFAMFVAGYFVAWRMHCV